MWVIVGDLVRDVGGDKMGGYKIPSPSGVSMMGVKYSHLGAWVTVHTHTGYSGGSVYAAVGQIDVANSGELVHSEYQFLARPLTLPPPFAAVQRSAGGLSLSVMTGSEEMKTKLLNAWANGVKKGLLTVDKGEYFPSSMARAIAYRVMQKKTVPWQALQDEE